MRTKLLPQAVFDHIRSSGIDFTDVKDGGECLLRILSDASINGRSFFLAPRKWAPRGYLDLNVDEISRGSLLARGSDRAD